MAVIRGTCLVGFTDLMATKGVDPVPMLRQVGIRVTDVGEHEAFISYLALVRLLERAAEATGMPDFGRQLATRQGIEILGPVGLAAQTAPTTGAGLAICSTYLSAYSPAIAVTLLPLDQPEELLLEFRILDPPAEPVSQVIELSLGVALRVLTYLRGSTYRPVGVHIPHAPLTLPSTYAAFYGCAPVFQTPSAGLRIRSEDLAKAVSNDALTHTTMRRYLDTLVASPEPGLSRPVHQLVRHLLPTGAVSARLIARQLGLHPKTMQRRLAEEGTSFAAIVEEARQELAEHFLRDTDLPLLQVARELGYAEQSVLTRSCQRWFGRSPSALRASLRLAAAPVAVSTFA